MLHLNGAGLPGSFLSSPNISFQHLAKLMESQNWHLKKKKTKTIGYHAFEDIFEKKNMDLLSQNQQCILSKNIGQSCFSSTLYN